MSEKKELFKSRRWNEYQNVQVLNETVAETEKSKKNVEFFLKYIKSKERKESTQKK